MNLNVIFEKHYFWYLTLISILFGSNCDGQKSLRNFIIQKPTKNAVAISSPGKAIIAGLLPIHQIYNQQEDKCNDIDDQGFHLIIAMIFAIEQVNNDPRLLPGVTLGYDIRDTCNNKKHTAREALKMLLRFLPFDEGTYGDYYCEVTDVEKLNDGPREKSVPFIGLIGTTTYESTVATANTLGKIKILFIPIDLTIPNLHPVF